MSADLKSLFPASPTLKSALRPEDLGAEPLARHLPWLSGGVLMVEATKQVYRPIEAYRERRRLLPVIPPALAPTAPQGFNAGNGR